MPIVHKLDYAMTDSVHVANDKQRSTAINTPCYRTVYSIYTLLVMLLFIFDKFKIF